MDALAHAGVAIMHHRINVCMLGGNLVNAAARAWRVRYRLRETGQFCMPSVRCIGKDVELASGTKPRHERAVDGHRMAEQFIRKL